MFFLKEFNPTKVKECNIPESRKRFKNSKNNNVRFLLEKRFYWMKEFLNKKKNIIELGSGNGSSRDMLNNRKIILTDIQKYPWITKKVDMNNLKLQKKYTNLISELKVKEYKFKIIRHRKKDALFQRIFKNFKRN